MRLLIAFEQDGFLQRGVAMNFSLNSTTRAGDAKKPALKQFDGAKMPAVRGVNALEAGIGNKGWLLEPVLNILKN
jgi:hypothetical protein